MDHFGSRRHRLNPGEVPLVRGLVLEKLCQLYADRCDLVQAEVFYRVIHRIDYYGPGRPCYPEFSWRFLGEYLVQVEASVFFDYGPFRVKDGGV
jgi:hypothetical protein